MPAEEYETRFSGRRSVRHRNLCLRRTRLTFTAGVHLLRPHPPRRLRRPSTCRPRRCARTHLTPSGWSCCSSGKRGHGACAEMTVDRQFPMCSASISCHVMRVPQGSPRLSKVLRGLRFAPGASPAGVWLPLQVQLAWCMAKASVQTKTLWRARRPGACFACADEHLADVMIYLVGAVPEEC